MTLDAMVCFVLLGHTMYWVEGNQTTHNVRVVLKQPIYYVAVSCPLRTPFTISKPSNDNDLQLQE